MKGKYKMIAKQMFLMIGWRRIKLMLANYLRRWVNISYPY